MPYRGVFSWFWGGSRGVNAFYGFPWRWPPKCLWPSDFRMNNQVISHDRRRAGCVTVEMDAGPAAYFPHEAEGEPRRRGVDANTFDFFRGRGAYCP